MNYTKSILIFLVVFELLIILILSSSIYNNKFDYENTTGLEKINDLNQINGYYKIPVRIINGETNIVFDGYQFDQFGNYHDFNDVFGVHHECRYGTIITKNFDSFFANLCFVKDGDKYKVANYKESDYLQPYYYEFYITDNNNLDIIRNELGIITTYHYEISSAKDYLATYPN